MTTQLKRQNTMTLTAITTDPATLLEQAKWSFSTRRVRREDSVELNTNYNQVKPGDLILGRVMQLGQHKGIQLTSGRRALIFPGDLVVLPCAARYAPDQFEGIAEIDPQGADMLAGGGCLGKMRAHNERIKPATKILPLGRLMGDTGEPINVANYAISAANTISSIPVIAVLGTAMNSGKTLATAQLSLGLRQAGLKVASIKATGTGAFGDYNEYLDSGVHYVADFTDAGMATTYLMPLEQIKDGIRRLLTASEEAGCDVVIMEIADGLFQRETSALIKDPEIQERLSGVVFACGDAVAAAGGVAELRQHGYEPNVLTGILSCSPMASEEAIQVTGVPVLSKSELADPSEAMSLLREISEKRQIAV